MSRLPPSVLPVAPLSLVDLATELLDRSRASESEGVVTTDIAHALLAAGALHPFDPNGTVRKDRYPFPKRDVPLLTMLLEKTPFWRAPGPVRNWPDAIDGFGTELFEQISDQLKGHAHPLRPIEKAQAIDVEWLGAVLLAAGADPWQERSATMPLGSALPQALRHGMTGLVERIMAMPGAPSWADVAMSPAPESTFASSGSWLVALSQSPYALPVLLQRLLQDVSDEALEGDHPLLRAQPWAVEAFAAADRLPTSTAMKAKVERAWGRRVKDQSLRPEALVQMAAALSGQAFTAQETEQAKRAGLVIEELGAVKWNKMRSGTKKYDLEMWLVSPPFAFCSVPSLANAGENGQGLGRCSNFYHSGSSALGLEKRRGRLAGFRPRSDLLFWSLRKDALRSSDDRPGRQSCGVVLLEHLFQQPPPFMP